MTIKERIATAAKDLGSRAKDTVRKTVAPTDLERMAKIKSETARRKHENERKEHYVKALEEREAARRKSESLRKRELKAQGDSGAKRAMQQIGQNSIGMGGSDFLGLPQEPRRSSNARKEQSLPAGPRWNTIWDQGIYGNEGTTPTRRSNRRKKSRKR